MAYQQQRILKYCKNSDIAASFVKESLSLAESRPDRQLIRITVTPPEGSGAFYVGVATWMLYQDLKMIQTEH